MFEILSYSKSRRIIPGNTFPSTIVIIRNNQIKLTEKKFEDFYAAILGLVEKKINSKDLLSLRYICNSNLNNEEGMLDGILVLLEVVVKIIGFPSCNPAKRLSKKNDDEELIYQLTFEEIDDEASYVLPILKFFFNWLSGMEKNENQTSEFSLYFDKFIKKISSNAPKGVNTLKLIEAAISLDIPCRRVASNTFQFGWGSKSRWLDSSFTDKTSAISANISRNKISTTHYLSKLGFPTPRNFLVKSLDNAINCANKLGFPVVVKAVDLDRGVGVFCDLKNEIEVARAYEKTKKYTSNIMVEEYIQGRDYRLQVCNGEVYWAIERQSPRVVGDGESNINQLIEKFNNERLIKNEQSETQLPVIIFNEDMHEYLMHNGYSLESIPEEGTVVKLRAANNITGGGSLIPVLDIAHDDNFQLAIEITKFLRLDVAGIDLIIPDIQKSWKTQKIAILEVNAKPQISGDRHKKLLKKLISGNGRIPIILFIGSLPESKMHQKIINFANMRKLKFGMISKNTIWSNLEKKDRSASDLFINTLNLISDPTIDAIFINMSLDFHLPLPIPIDKFDAIVLSDKLKENHSDNEIKERSKNLEKYSELLITLNVDDHFLIDIPEEKKLNIINMNETEFIKYIAQFFD